jgi:hypothetical protein
MSANTNLGAYGLMYVVKNNKSDVLALLLKNGVVVPSNASDITIALAVTNLSKVSKSFYNEFTKLLVNQDTVSGMSANMSGSYSNFDGDSPFCKNNDNKTSSPTTYKLICGNTTTTEDTTSKSGNNSDLLNKGLGLLQIGFEGFLKLDDNKTKRQLADASVIITNTNADKKDEDKDKGMSTGAIIGLSLLGVTIVGLVVYLIVKKK